MLKIEEIFRVLYTAIKKLGTASRHLKVVVRNAVFMRLTSVLKLSNTPILRQSMQDF